MRTAWSTAREASGVRLQKSEEAREGCPRPLHLPPNTPGQRAKWYVHRIVRPPEPYLWPGMSREEWVAANADVKTDPPVYVLERIARKLTAPSR